MSQSRPSDTLTAVSTSPLFLLASASPRRKVLLESLGLPFAVASNPWTEEPRPGELARHQVRRLAREKLSHFLTLHPANVLPVLTADTLLSFRGRALNKPADAAEAWAFYQALAGRRHQVLTSVAFSVPSQGIVHQITVSTLVQFVRWDPPLYRRYLMREEWKDAAGGYQIQETGSILVQRLVGSWSNVVGLPIPEVYAMIRSTLRIPRD